MHCHPLLEYRDRGFDTRSGNLQMSALRPISLDTLRLADPPSSVNHKTADTVTEELLYFTVLHSNVKVYIQTNVFAI
jgi:hypothetical protein